jgi:hypothetical protein
VNACPSPLRPLTELKSLDREAAVAEHEWVTQPGERLTRTQLSTLYGGSVYSGGVVPSRTTPNVLIFSDPKQAEKSGYVYDGRDATSAAFYYTGKGGSGDQTLTVNAAIAQHTEHGRSLRLFVADGRVAGTQTTLQRYVGEYRLDADAPWEEKAAPGRDKKTRMVLVFRLLPVGDESSEAVNSLPLVAPHTGEVGSAVLVPEELHTTRFFEVSGSEPSRARRVESDLVASFRASTGVHYMRWAIPLGAGSARNLLTDIYDPEARRLYEAKSSAGRGDVRMAIGQLLDYRRYIAVPGLVCVILLPERPAEDLCELIGLVGFDLAFEEDGVFVSYGAKELISTRSSVDDFGAVATDR